MKYILTTISILFCAVSCLAQLDSIQQLEEVQILDTRLFHFSESYKVKTISDTILKQNSTSLTNVLRYNSSIYFKENGYGMVSSASFRGTNASQTAVVWNGININSVLTGQTDFNTISPLSYHSVSVRSGGGSTQYGSGAIGGSIHLNNNLHFKNNEIFEVGMQKGSFSTISSNAKYLFATKKWFVNTSMYFISSKNDYKFIGKNKKNTNGEFLKWSVANTIGYKFKKNKISFTSDYFYGNRNFSSSLTTISKDNYKDISTKNLLSWRYIHHRISSSLKVAHLFEKYRYYPNTKDVLYFYGKANSMVTDYTFDFYWNKKLSTSLVTNYTYVEARGSNIYSKSRNTLATTLLLKHNVHATFGYGIHVRQEFLNEFENPFLFGWNAKYNINSWYSILVNASKNYKVPSFNDLYWREGGNENLQPETSMQGEIGNVFTFKNFHFSIHGFYIKSNNLIQWRPNENNIWNPVNILKTNNYGIECKVFLYKKINKHRFNLQLDYSYTKAINLEKNKQLIYVPLHKTIGILDYKIANFSAYFQTLYNGKVYTTTDNKTKLPSYIISNLGASYTINNKIKMGFKLNNVFNKYYENVAFRPMPNRNSQLYINFKI